MSIKVRRLHWFDLLWLMFYDYKTYKPILFNLGYFNHHSYIAFDGWTYLGIGGVQILWDGLGEGYVILTDRFKESPQKLCRLIKQKTAEIEREKRLFRLQAFVLYDYEQGCRFAEFLGLTVEARINSYGPNRETYWLFSKVYT